MRKQSSDFLFDFDPLDSPMGEGATTRGSTDFEATLILTRRIGLWKSNSTPKTLRILNKFRQHTTQIFASIFIFLTSDFLFCMGGMVEK